MQFACRFLSDKSLCNSLIYFVAYIKNYEFCTNALKGDTNLDGVVDSKDATEILTYSALYGVGQEPYFPTTGKDASDLLTKLDYLVSDIDTESKAGVVEEGVSAIDSKDAAYLLTYAAMVGVGQEPTWEEVIK